MKGQKEIEDRIRHYKTHTYYNDLESISARVINIRSRIAELEWVLGKNKINSSLS